MEASTVAAIRAKPCLLRSGISDRGCVIARLLR
jgi:hypothetical protein